MANGQLPQTVCIRGSSADKVNQEYYLTNITYWDAPVYKSQNETDGNYTNGYLYLYVDYNINSTIGTSGWEWKISTSVNDPWWRYTYIVGVESSGAREIPGKVLLFGVD